MKKISYTELKAIIYKHAKWLRGEDGGVCADLRGADLHSADLRDADLRGANLRGADLSGANLNSADLSSADLRVADLRDADLRVADLRDYYIAAHRRLKWAVKHDRPWEEIEDKSYVAAALKWAEEMAAKAVREEA